MNSHLISVVTVSFNAVETIEKTILSVINQNYTNIEYIIIDGGSTDGTVDIIKKYENKISYWISEPDKGIYDAMNKGISQATGEWINFMNSGDEFYTENVLTEVFSESFSEEIKVIYGKTALVFPKKTLISRPLSIGHIEKGMPFCHQSTFVRTNLYKENPYNLTYKICADYNFFYSVYKKGYTFYYKKILISKFLYGGLSSSSSIDLIVEERHISGKKYNLYFFKKLLKELLLGKLYRTYRKLL